MTIRKFRARLTHKPGRGTSKMDQDAPLPAAVSRLPYRYYQVTLRRGTNGLPGKTVASVRELGLTTRHQVVWVRVTQKNAGLIMKVKELVDVRLVNQIPPKRPIPLGYKKVGSALGTTTLVQ
ncbi:hypothetical protein DFJ73DRAFT_826511 [Zopfochytrium polystomum]|nr:hypothetical protein DFJ73DRAFT_826511 [Zopfochytrium polystomum]